MWATAFTGVAGRERSRVVHSNAATIDAAPATLPVTNALRA
jgi:hypothetical protein